MADRPDIFVCLLAWRRPLLVVPAVTALVVLCGSLLLPNVFQATATILPPYEESGLGAIGGMLGLSMGGGGMSLPFLATPSDVYATIIGSRSAAETVIDSLGLVEYFECGTRDAAVETFSRRLSVSVGSEGSISVAFVDEDPDTAAAIVNALLTALDDINTRTSSARARHARVPRRAAQAHDGGAPRR